MKYSVIIPVYNAEQTLARCLDSLLAEHYSDVEIILVNDGSKDSSGSICREYTEKHSNIRCIDKENGGVSTARNAGLDIASGDFVLFVDSDDYVLPGFFSILDDALRKSPCDLVQFSYCFDNGTEKRNRIYTPKAAFSREQAFPMLIDAMCRKSINGPVAKLYHRELIEAFHIRFPEGASVAEDRAFNIHYSFYVQSYSVSDQVLYCVSTENQDSLTRGKNRDLQKEFAITGKYFQDSLQNAPIPKSEKEQYRRAANFGDCRFIYHEAKQLFWAHIGWLERQKRLGKMCDAINRKKMKYPHTRYSTLITLPVRLRLTPVIDAIAWKLTR